MSSRVLVLNLRLRGDAAACRLAEAADAEPLWLTWRSLTGTFRSDAPQVHGVPGEARLLAQPVGREPGITEHWSRPVPWFGEVEFHRRAEEQLEQFVEVRR